MIVVLMGVSLVPCKCLRGDKGCETGKDGKSSLFTVNLSAPASERDVSRWTGVPSPFKQTLPINGFKAVLGGE